MRPTSRPLLPVLAFAAFIGASSAQQRPQPTPEQLQAQSDYFKREEALRARQAQIRAEIADIKAGKIEPGAEWAKEWAGEYYCGDGTGMNVSISIAPNAGMTYTWRGCLGLYEFNYGKIVETGADSVTVKLELTNQNESFGFISDTLYFVRWGDRRLLLPRQSMLELIGWLNSCGDSHVLSLYLPCAGRPHSFHSAPPGLPDVPAEFKSRLLVQPLEAALTSVQPLETSEINRANSNFNFRVEFNKGARDGVRVNTVLDEPWGARGYLTITSVSDHTSVAELWLFAPKGDQAKHPAVGDTLTLLATKSASPESPPRAAPQTEP